MEMKWSPTIMDGLFCDKKDHLGLYYWFEALMEKKKWLRLKPKEQMKVTYDHL